MKYISLLLFFVILGCEECYDKEYFYSTAKNASVTNLKFNICRKDFRSNRASVTVLAGDSFSFDWEWKKIYRGYNPFSQSPYSSCYGKDERTEVAFLIASDSTSIVKLCSHNVEKDDFVVVAAADGCPNSYSEITEHCP
jgi:hypothetical protein